MYKLLLVESFIVLILIGVVVLGINAIFFLPTIPGPLKKNPKISLYGNPTHCGYSSDSTLL